MGASDIESYTRVEILSAHGPAEETWTNAQLLIRSWFLPHNIITIMGVRAWLTRTLAFCANDLKRIRKKKKKNEVFFFFSIRTNTIL